MQYALKFILDFAAVFVLELIVLYPQLGDRS